MTVVIPDGALSPVVSVGQAQQVNITALHKKKAYIF